MKNCAIVVAVCVGTVVSFGPSCGSAHASDSRDVLRQTSHAFAEIARGAIPSIVFIKVEKDVTADRDQQVLELFGEQFMRRATPGPQSRHAPRQRQFRQIGQGSGFLITKDGYILTNNHVVGDVDKITVTLNDGREFEAQLIGADPQSEVAVIRIKGANFPYLELGDSAALGIGEWVIAVGNPFGLTESVTVGVVSAKERSNIGITDYEDFIQTDAAINPGNSGGPLLNIDGKVIGINTAIFSESGGYMGIGFAIPINMVKSIKDQLMKTGKVVRGYLGVVVQEMTQDLVGSFGLNEKKGVLISDVTDGSPGQKAGLKPGDVVLTLNGKEVQDAGLFRNTVAATLPGTRLTLTVIDDGKQREVIATTGNLPEGVAAASDEPPQLETLGLDVEELTAELAQQFGYAVGKGVIVSQVLPGGPAWQAGIRAGNLIESVNRSSVATVAEFKAALARLKDKVLLLVRNAHGSRYVVLDGK